MADEALVARAVAEVDEVYHLAAAVGVRLIAQSPIRTIETNIYTTELLLRQLGRQIDAGRQVKFFMASSSEVYGKNPKAQWTEEDDLVLGPTTRSRWSYGASKAIDEFLALAYLARTAAAGGDRPVFQRRGAEADRGLRDGVATAGRRRLGRRPAGGPRRRPAAARASPTSPTWCGWSWP